jgi:hypothetical protein
VERGVDGSPRRELSGREPLHHLLERERVVAHELRVLLDVRLRRLGGLAVMIERLRLAEAGDAGVPELDDDGDLAVSRAAGDDERLRKLERDDPGGDLHGRNVPTADRR